MNYPPINDGPGPPTDLDLLVLEAGRPRTPRPTVRGVIWHVMGTSIIALIGISIAQAFYSDWTASRSLATLWFSDWVRALAIVVFLLLTIASFRQRARDRELTANGNAAMATVLSQENALEERVLDNILFHRHSRREISGVVLRQDQVTLQRYEISRVL